MICMFCSSRQKCWEDKSDEELALEWIKCDYADYVMDEKIELDDLLAESDRRIEVRKAMEENG